MISARIAEQIRGDIEGDGFLLREHLGPYDLFFLEYEYPALWTAWASTLSGSPAEIRASKALLAALDACAAGTPTEAPRTFVVGDRVIGRDIEGEVVALDSAIELRGLLVQGDTRRMWQFAHQCVLVTSDVLPHTITPVWVTRLLALAQAQHEAAVACKAAEEWYDGAYVVYEKVRVARAEARDLVQKRSRELREATTALALLEAAK